MKNIILVLFTFFLISFCHTSKKISNDNTHQNNNKEIKTENDGTSFDKAIIIEEQTESKGVNAEYIWLKQHYPGYKLKNQSLSNYNKKPYDVMNIVTSEGENKNIYFDITNFYGKY
jgi:hypothetical protein